MKKTLLMAAVLLAGFAATGTYHAYYQKRGVELGCSGELTSRRLADDGKTVELKIKITTFIKDNGQAVLLQQGELSAGKDIYVVDREIKFTYDKLDEKGVHTTKLEKMDKRKNDNTPPSLSKEFPILGDMSNMGYVHITSINGQAYLFHELSMPYFLCANF